jgi:hypothetical protein
MKKIILIGIGGYLLFTVGWYSWNWDMVQETIKEEANSEPAEIHREMLDDGFYMWGWDEETDTPQLAGDTVFFPIDSDLPRMKLKNGERVPLDEDEDVWDTPYN